MAMVKIDQIDDQAVLDALVFKIVHPAQTYILGVGGSSGRMRYRRDVDEGWRYYNPTAYDGGTYAELIQTYCAGMIKLPDGMCEATVFRPGTVTPCSAIAPTFRIALMRAIIRSHCDGDSVEYPALESIS